MLQVPYPTLEELLKMMGETGKRLSEIDASEATAGNISIFLNWPIDVKTLFPLVEEIELPQSVPELAGGTFIVSGSGRRLREIIDDPVSNVGCIKVKEGGETGDLFTLDPRPFVRVTSEFNSHLAVHYDQVVSSGTNFHAVVHAQPVHLTYLSHIPRYRDEQYLNAHLLRWQPETIVNLPEGIGFVPFEIPGSPALMKRTLESLRKHGIVIWAKHGVMARSEVSVKHAGDRVEFAETAANYETLNLSTGGNGEGLTVEEIRAICETFNLEQNFF